MNPTALSLISVYVLLVETLQELSIHLYNEIKWLLLIGLCRRVVKKWAKLQQSKSTTAATSIVFGNVRIRFRINFE